jgi:hypothetical protein
MGQAMSEAFVESEMQRIPGGGEEFIIRRILTYSGTTFVLTQSAHSRVLAIYEGMKRMTPLSQPRIVHTIRGSSYGLR